MADDTLRLVARVEDQFTGPLARLTTALRRVGDADVAKTVRRDWGEVGKQVERVAGSFGGVVPLLSGIGAGSLTAAGALGGAAIALRNFAGNTQQLSVLSRETGLAVDKLRAFGEIGQRFGVSADAMKGSLVQFNATIFDLQRRWGETYNTLRAMNLGELVEKMISAKSMDEKLKLAFEGLQSISDPEIRRRVSRLIFGTDDVGRVAAAITKGAFEPMMAEIQRNSGQITKELEAQAQKFEDSLSKLRQSAEKGKVEILGPLLDGLNTVIEWGDKGDVIGHAATALRRKLFGDKSVDGAPGQAAPGILSRGITDREALEERKARLTKRLEGLEGGPRDQDYARKRDRLIEELKRVGDELARLREQAPTVQQQSFSGQAGGRGLIHKAAFGGGFGFGTGVGIGYGGGGTGPAALAGGAPGGGRNSPGGGAAGGSGGVAPGGSSAGSLTALIDEEARKAGVDPRVMHGIRAGESHRRGTYDVKHDAIESSWGPFQLNRRRGLGVQFEKETGLDLRDPRTIAAQARWVANYLAKGGSLRAWAGYRGPRDADPRWGNSGYVPDPGAGGGKAALGQAGENGQFDPLGGAGRFGSAFGMRNHPIHGGQRMHWGQDMPAPAGTGVSAMQGGKVTTINRHGDVTVTHADGSTKTYRHIAPGDIGVGQDVQAGQRIGSLRAHDPRSTGPHLHVEATDANGRRYNPLAEIQAARRARENAATSRTGDEMMRRSRQWQSGAPAAGSPASSAAKGTLDINLNGFPAGTRARASMDDIFKDVKVSRGRQMATTE